MGQVSIFGLKGSGKTCYLYAMATMLNEGIEIGQNEKITISTPDIEQQIRLNDGYLELASGIWPQGSAETTFYTFDVKMPENGVYQEVMSFQMQDYRGGAWNGRLQEDAEVREELLQEFEDSTAIIFMVDGQSLLDLQHSDQNDTVTKIRARQNIAFIQTLFNEYVNRAGINNVAPILLAITKSDLFTPETEETAKRYLRDHLPALFNNGSGVFVAITTVAIGENLTKGEDGSLKGRLILNDRYNLHIPMLFPIYCHWSDMDETDMDENTERRMAIMRRLFEKRVDFYKSGRLAIGL